MRALCIALLAGCGASSTAVSYTNFVDPQPASLCAEYDRPCDDIGPLLESSPECPTAVPRRFKATNTLTGHGVVCTAFPVNGYWITAAHCGVGNENRDYVLEGGWPMEFVAGGDWHGGAVADNRRDEDWAVFVGGPSLTGFQYDPTPPLPGDYLEAWGFPGVVRVARRRGRLLRVENFYGVLGVPVIPGDSGGPVGHGCYFNGLVSLVYLYVDGARPLVGDAGVSFFSPGIFDYIIP